MQYVKDRVAPKASHILGALFVASLGLSAAVAEQFAPYEEIRKKSQIFEPKPSFDATPVTVRIASVTYRIPRNYLTLLEPAIPTLRVTFPNFKPLTKETRNCFDRKWQFRNPEGCTFLEFLLFGSAGPGPGGRALTNAEKFENVLKHSPAARFRVGPFGYDVYEIGPETARIETYRRREGDILFKCSFIGHAEQKKTVDVCDDMFRLDDMNHLQFFFRVHQIKYVPEIEATMRRLMSGFVSMGSDNNGVDNPK